MGVGVLTGVAVGVGMGVGFVVGVALASGDGVDTAAWAGAGWAPAGIAAAGPLLRVRPSWPLCDWLGGPEASPSSPLA